MGIGKFIRRTNYPTAYLEGTFEDKFYKDVVEPAKAGTKSKPSLGQLIKNWRPHKAFMPQSMGGTFYTKGTPAALKALRGSGIVGAATLGAEGGAKLGNWAYKNWEPATKFGDWIGSNIYDAVQNYGKAQASIPTTQEDRVKAGIQRQMINEGTATPMARRTYGDMSMGQGRPDWVADRSPVQQGLKSIEIGMAPEIKEAIYQDRIMNPNLPRFASQPQYRIRDQLKRDFLQGGLWKDATQSLGQTKDALFKDFQGLDSLKDRVVNSATGFWDTIGGGIESIMDNTLIGRISAMNDATNPRAWNYNPKLQGQIDYLKEQGKYGAMDQSGLNKITGGVLAGKNLQSFFGSNDLGTMYDKSIGQTQKTIDNFANQWSNLKENDPYEYNKKLAWHQNKLAKKKKEQDIFNANQKKITDQRIAAERTAGAAANQATQRRAGRGGDHMSRSRDQGGLGISRSQAQAVSDANRNAGMGGWGLKEGGIASLWRR